MNLFNPTICPFCSGKKLYTVSKTSLKCASCHKKYSTKKLETDATCIEFFCKDTSANKCAQSLHVNYKTIQNRYMDFRKLIMLYIEDTYKAKQALFTEYDEYYFLPKNKRGKVKYLFESIGILGQVYEDTVYTILLPDQFSHLRQEALLNPEVNFAYLKEYSRFLNRYKIVHFEKFDSKIIRFWVFLEEKLAHFKGIDRENFAFYLKEYEFKFNHTVEEQQNILWKLWIDTK